MPSIYLLVTISHCDSVQWIKQNVDVLGRYLIKNKLSSKYSIPIHCTWVRPWRHVCRRIISHQACIFNNEFLFTFSFVPGSIDTELYIFNHKVLITPVASLNYFTVFMFNSTTIYNIGRYFCISLVWSNHIDLSCCSCIRVTFPFSFCFSQSQPSRSTKSQQLRWQLLSAPSRRQKSPRLRPLRAQHHRKSPVPPSETATVSSEASVTEWMTLLLCVQCVHTASGVSEVRWSATASVF